ncbi:hypothetical protein EML15_08880 [Corynebacterium sp. sy017]|nr:hypothetical protein [Corynebacterium sp. sy017]
MTNNFPQGSGFGGGTHNSSNAQWVDSSQAPATGYNATGYNATHSSVPVRFVSGPWAPVIIAAVCAFLGLCIGLGVLISPLNATDSAYVAIASVGWLLCGVISFVVLGIYLMKDNAIRAANPYIGNGTQVLLYRLSIAAGLLGVLITGCEIALWFSKL